ncbi:hypothetical protein GGX14DRAFT_636389 [Mycena pura]|uniref:FAD-binding FR-type domain-containing protein n=1 Tax=Mycena pura TaxID=153505 RepID=A0AAD6YDF6_9AGAR|nr:hypothetical protein GGX14DRAFT_636389 [Mycena pura]
MRLRLRRLSPDKTAPLTVLYGSNTGTCQMLASRLASEAVRHSFRADMDLAVPLRGHQARRRGHKDWASTYHLVDELFAKHGGQRLAERGASDARKRDMFGDFTAWTDPSLWPALTPFAIKSGVATRSDSPVTAPVVAIDVDVQNEDRESHLQQNLQQNVSWATVVDARELNADGGTQKRHIEFELPEGHGWGPFAVLPLNPQTAAKRVMNHFSLPPDGSSATLPINKPLPLTDPHQGYIELAQPATRSDIEILVQHAADACEKAALHSLLDDKGAFCKKGLEKRVSALDLVTSHHCQTALPRVPRTAPPLQPRYYSISSSPANTCRRTLTYTVIHGTSWSSAGNSTTDAAAPEPFVGVSGSYLRSLKAGDQALTTPLLMICAGSGLAPFRGFVHERCWGGWKLAPAILFAGCRGRDTVRLYAKEMDEWAALGAVDVRYAFSRDATTATPESARCKYVLDHMLHDMADIIEMFKNGGKFCICGGFEVAKGIGGAARKIIAHQPS